MTRSASPYSANKRQPRAFARRAAWVEFDALARGRGRPVFAHSRRPEWQLRMVAIHLSRCSAGASINARSGGPLPFRIRCWRSALPSSSTVPRDSAIAVTNGDGQKCCARSRARSPSRAHAPRTSSGRRPAPGQRPQSRRRPGLRGRLFSQRCSLRLRRKRQIGVGEESAKFGDGIAPLGFNAQERHADFRKDRVDEGVAVPTFGKEMAAVIDLDRGDGSRVRTSQITKSTLVAITALRARRRRWTLALLAGFASSANRTCANARKLRPSAALSVRRKIFSLAL